MKDCHVRPSAQVCTLRNYEVSRLSSLLSHEHAAFALVLFFCDILIPEPTLMPLALALRQSQSMPAPIAIVDPVPLPQARQLTVCLTAPAYR